jgi:hypothetical protein
MASERGRLGCAAVVLGICCLFIASCAGEAVQVPEGTPCRGPVEDHDPSLDELLCAGFKFADPPFKLAAKVLDEGVVVSWVGTGQENLEYRVRRRVPPSNDWQALGVVPGGRFARGEFSFVDVTATHGVTYVYGATASNTAYKTESQLMVTPPISVP